MRAVCIMLTILSIPLWLTGLVVGWIFWSTYAGFLVAKECIPNVLETAIGGR